MSTSLTSADAAPGSAAEKATLAALRRALQRAQGFTLVVAVCNSPARRDRLIGQLAASLPGGLRVVRIRRDDDDILAAIQEQVHNPDGTPVAVVGLEEGITIASPDHARLVRLNLKREEWRARLRGPVVIWTPEFLLRSLARAAPDFLDWRAGTYLFVEPEQSLPPTPASMLAGVEFARLTAEERQQRIAQLRELIAQYSQSPQEEGHAIATWLDELGHHLKFVGNLEESLSILKQREEICRRLGDPAGLYASLGNQALILMAQGDLEGAMRLHKQKEEICRRLGDPAGLQRSLGNQALILKAQGDLEGAMRLHHQEEEICRRLGDPNGLAITLVNQASLLAFQRNRPQEAWPLVEEAYALALRHGYRALAEQIRPIHEEIRQRAGK